MTEAENRGRFVWHELMTTDPSAAQRFYTEVLGWGLSTYPGSDYVLFTRQAAGLAGIMELPETARKMGAQPHWLTYVATPDVDESASRATALGATLYVEARDIPTVGRFAVLADPHGATFALFWPLSPWTPERVPQVGEFSWHELVTTDPDAAWSFYSSFAGWEKTGAHDMGPMGTYQMYGRHGHTYGGIFKRPADMPAPPHWLPYIRVADVGQAAAAVRAHGGRVLHGPVEVPGGDWIAQCLDPQGAAFAVHQRK